MKRAGVRWIRWTVRWGFSRVESGTCASWRWRRRSPVVLWRLWRRTPANSVPTNLRWKICTVHPRRPCKKANRPIFSLSHWRLNSPTRSVPPWDPARGVNIQESNGPRMGKRRWIQRSPWWRALEVLATIGSFWICLSEREFLSLMKSCGLEVTERRCKR